MGSKKASGPPVKDDVAKSRLTYSVSDIGARFSNEDRVLLDLGALDHAIVFSLIERLGWQATWEEGEEEAGLDASERIHAQFLEITNMSELVNKLEEIRQAVAALDLSVNVASAVPDITVEPAPATVDVTAPVTVNPAVTIEPTPTYIYVYTTDGAEVQTGTGEAGGELGSGPGKSKGIVQPTSTETDDDFFRVPTVPPVIYEDRFGGSNLLGRSPTFNPHAYEITTPDSNPNGMISVDDLSMKFRESGGSEGHVFYGGSTKTPTRLITAWNPIATTNSGSNWFGVWMYAGWQAYYTPELAPTGNHDLVGFYLWMNTNGYMGITHYYVTQAFPQEGTRQGSQLGKNMTFTTGTNWALNHQFLLDAQLIRAVPNDTGIIRTTDLLRLTAYRYEPNGTLALEGIQELNPVVPLSPVPYRFGAYALNVDVDLWAMRAENNQDDYDVIV